MKGKSRWKWCTQLKTCTPSRWCSATPPFLTARRALKSSSSFLVTKVTKTIIQLIFLKNFVFPIPLSLSLLFYTRHVCFDGVRRSTTLHRKCKGNMFRCVCSTQSQARLDQRLLITSRWNTQFPLEYSNNLMIKSYI